MNRLTQKSPSTITIDGVEHKINTNFRDCLKTIQALQDKKLTLDERTGILLYNIYEEIPANVNQAIEKAILFLRRGKEINDDKNIENLCDFEQDANYIYDAILKKGVDLDKCDDLHWWTFMSYFSEIDESMFSRIVYLRSKNNKGKLTKEEKRECSRIGWDIVRMTSEEELKQRQDDAAFFEERMKRFDKRL